MKEIIAVEDIDAFWNNLGNRNKLYQVEIDGKVFKDMEFSYIKDDVEKFVFTKTKKVRK